MRFLKAIRECSSYFRKQSPEAISEGTISWKNCFWLSAGNCQNCAKIKFDGAGQAFLHKKTRLKMWKNACLTPYNDILLYFWFLLNNQVQFYQNFEHCRLGETIANISNSNKVLKRILRISFSCFLFFSCLKWYFCLPTCQAFFEAPLKCALQANWGCLLILKPETPEIYLE